ncbi:MAG: ABC transporter permease [Corallococcus sp.]|nr:ABC transporter permease [Bacillota bacterium]MCM1533806.1 ABC transporter permease [Corallococcus sp.]
MPKRYDTFTREHLLFLKKQRTRNILVHVTQVGVLVLLLAFWELAAHLQWIDVFIMSCPSRIWLTLAELSQGGTLWYHAGVSTLETLVGFAIGTVLGYVIAVILWWNNFLKDVFEPYVVVINSLPKIALGPIIIIWVGTGKASIITMAVLISVVITAITILNGFTETDKDKALLLRSMRANRFQIFTKLVAPSNVPTLMATLKINVGMSWIGTIMGEYLVSKEGLGYLLVYGSQVFRLDVVMTCTIVLCALAGIMYGLVAVLEKIVVKNFR